MELTIGIFFDGTGNSIHDTPSTITNVAKLYRVYAESDAPAIKKLYVRGVGSIKHPDDNDGLGGRTIIAQGIDRMFGGAFGTGGHERINYILDKARAAISNTPGVTKLTLDVFGFSRGAALARHFVNAVNAKPLYSRQVVRFLGIYDTVGSFGIPGNDYDNYNFHVGKNSAKYVYHLVAENELRKNFDLQSIRHDSSVAFELDDSACTGNRWAVEILCPGVHSDVGGGYDQLKPGAKKLEHGNNNNRLSRYYLKQMYDRAIACGVPFNDVSTTEYNLHWKYPDTLDGSIKSLISRYRRNPRLRTCHAILRETEQSVDVFTDELRGIPKRIRNKRPNPLYRQRKHEIEVTKQTVLPLLESLFVKEVFRNNQAACKNFISSYTKFYKRYIHISNAPANDMIGMDAQITSSLVNTRVWPALEKVAYASLIKRAVKRDIFYNR